MNVIVISLITLGVIGALAAIILFFVAKKFAVYEDPRVDQVEAVLPGANCGGCGYPGCHGFADACVKADDLGKMLCPVGGAPVMEKVGAILGKTAAAAEPTVAVVRCNGTCEHRPRTNEYDGVKSCAIAHSLLHILQRARGHYTPVHHGQRFDLGGIRIHGQDGTVMVNGDLMVCHWETPVDFLVRIKQRLCHKNNKQYFQYVKK